ncbi:MAG: hypothetical protein U0805_03435 [Pirellulales bacterium]
MTEATAEVSEAASEPKAFIAAQLASQAFGKLKASARQAVAIVMVPGFPLRQFAGAVSRAAL